LVNAGLASMNKITFESKPGLCYNWDALDVTYPDVNP
jgi:hypothetical protein